MWYPLRRLCQSVAVGFLLAAAVMAVPSAGAAGRGIWLTPAEVRGLPMSGTAWLNVKREADAPLPQAQVSDQGSSHDTSTLAVALVAARTGDPSYRRKAADAIMDAIGTEDGPLSAGTRILPVSRNASSYVIAADLIDLHGYDARMGDRFRAWIEDLRTRVWDGKRTLGEEYETNATNHGTMAGQSVIAIAAYLGDGAALARGAKVFKGWLGDRSSHQFSRYGAAENLDDVYSFMPDPSQPRPVNPPGATKGGHSVDGVLPAEWARCGPFRWPPCYTDYAWGGLSGAVVSAELLYRAGYTDVYAWEGWALLRAYQRLYEQSQLDRAWWGEATSGNDAWQPWLANYIYGTSFPAVSPTRAGMNIGWTDWTHAAPRGMLPPVGAPQGPPGAGADRTAPMLRRLTVRPRHARRGAVVSYTLSEAARVRFRVRRCVPRNRGLRRCARYKRFRPGFTHVGRAGRNRFRFTGRVGGRRLRAGRWRLVARPTDAAGNRGHAVHTSFRIVRR
jgi:hypothetical protein